MDNMLTTSQLVELLKNQLKKFALHQFNIQQTTKTYDNILANLDQYSVLKIHDFSENYTYLLPEEIQSIHWTQETVTIYPVVVMRKIGENIGEDHLVFISDEKKKDVPFAEHCNDILQNHYITQGVSIKHDIEYNDGCTS